MSEEIIGVTGHRCDKLNNEWGYKGPMTRYLVDEFTRILKPRDPKFGVCGGALGTDTIYGFTCLKLNIPLWLALPCRGQDKFWNEESKRYYHILLNRATKVTYVHDGPYYVGCMNKRNYWMNDITTLLISVFNGSKGGTWNCVMDAKKRGKEIINIDPSTINLLLL